MAGRACGKPHDSELTAGCGRGEPCRPGVPWLCLLYPSLSPATLGEQENSGTTLASEKGYLQNLPHGVAQLKIRSYMLGVGGQWPLSGTADQREDEKTGSGFRNWGTSGGNATQEVCTGSLQEQGGLNPVRPQRDAQMPLVGELFSLLPRRSSCSKSPQRARGSCAQAGYGKLCDVLCSGAGCQAKLGCLCTPPLHRLLPGC